GKADGELDRLATLDDHVHVIAVRTDPLQHVVDDGLRRFAARIVRGDDVHVVVERREAIELAIGLARPGDAVVIAGKGHESTQTIGDTVVDFDEVLVARDLVGARS
ncbi:MAG: glutamate ligase domain-containing protein, partial [Actinomycetota bacterium]